MKLNKFNINPLCMVFSLGMKGKIHFLSDRTYLMLMYWIKFRKRLDLTNPKTFNEKLQWLKLNDYSHLYAKLVDKYEVKKYVESVIGKDYVIPTLGVWEAFDDIDFDILPNQFVLKCTHDSGGLVIVKDKNQLDRKSAKKKIDDALKRNYYWVGRERPYKRVKPRIIAEEYLHETEQVCNSITGIQDFKLLVFAGKTELILVCNDRYSSHRMTEDFFDIHWNRLNICRLKHGNSTKKILKPQNLELMCKLANKLTKAMIFARVDFYNINGKVYFGEITFYPASGFDGFQPNTWDRKLGELLNLNKSN